MEITSASLRQSFHWRMTESVLDISSSSGFVDSIAKFALATMSAAMRVALSRKLGSDRRAGRSGTLELFKEARGAPPWSRRHSCIGRVSGGIETTAKGFRYLAGVSTGNQFSKNPTRITASLFRVFKGVVIGERLIESPDLKNSSPSVWLQSALG